MVKIMHDMCNWILQKLAWLKNSSISINISDLFVNVTLSVMKMFSCISFCMELTKSIVRAAAISHKKSCLSISIIIKIIQMKLNNSSLP